MVGAAARVEAGDRLKEAVRVDVDATRTLAPQSSAAEPVADHVLDVEAAAGVDQQALAMAAAQHRQRRGGGAEHRHAFDLGRGMADAPGDAVGFGRILGGNDDRRQPPERRHRRLAPGLGLGGVEAGGVARHQRGDHRRIGIVGLDQDAAGLVAAPGAAGDLLDLLEAALGGAQVAAGRPRSASTTPTSVRLGK